MNSTITKKIINFIKYHNAFTIILLCVFLFSGIVFASGDAREAVIGEKVITKSGLDNTELLNTDLDNFDLQMTIISISEDDKKYYIEYSFNTLGIQNNVWQAITNHPTLSVYKDALGENDLGLYITEKFSQVADYQLSYLKEAQEAEIEKGKQQIVETTQYTGLYYSLIGKVLDIKEKALPGYEPVVVAPVIEPRITDGGRNIANPSVSLETSTSTCATGTEIRFTATASSFFTTTLTYDWDFGDGATTTNNNSVIHTYNATGTYSVKVTVSGESQTASTSTQIIIVDPAAPTTTPPEICASSSLQYCTTTEICAGVGGNWYNDICNAEPQATCDADHLDLCDTQDKCKGAGLYWYDNQCNNQSQPTCDGEHLDLCEIESDCVNAGGAWYDDTCNSECQTKTFYLDADGDGFGDPNNSITTCEQPADYVIDNTDCDDTSSSTYPGATEICGNSIDEDCNGEDLACQCGKDYLNLCNSSSTCVTAGGFWYDDTCNSECQTKTFYFDADGDGYGTSGQVTTACDTVPPDGYVTSSDDCNDTDADINPSVQEICDNGIDNNCDGQIDEGCPTCDASHLNLCTDKTSCQDAGGTWDASSTSCVNKS